jgi:acyl-[acyl-carrier-protein] desaturase
MLQLQTGYDRESIDPLRGLAYVAFQEVATRVAHRRTGRFSEDPVADRIMDRIASDENLHAVFYRDILAAAFAVTPSAATEAVVAEVLAFDMPGTAIPGYLRKATMIARAGIFDLRIHHDEVLWPMLRHWRVFEREGLDPSAEAARDRLAAYLTELDTSASRFEDRRATWKRDTGESNVALQLLQER